LQKKIAEMLLTRILAVFFFIVSIGLAAFLVHRIKFKIDEDKRIERTEQQVINRLKMIRDAQVAYLAVNRKYTGNWDTLINFIDTGHIYLTQRTERVIMKDYGNDEIIITIDTIGKVQVFDSVFVVREPMLALTSGTVREVNVTEGATVNRGDVVAVLQSDRGRTVRLRAPVTASVETVYAKAGDEVISSSGIVQLSYNRIADIRNLPFIPGSTRNAQFDLFAGKTTKGNVVVDIFEALDVDPVNPARRKNNKENALRVGSRTDVSISGNWE
jgi:hypothetical protein